MKTKTMTRLASSLALAALLAVPALPAAAQADFSKFVSVGASVDSGYLDGCWVKYGQIDGWTAIVARQAGAASYEQPLLDTPGTGCMVLTAIAPAPVFQYRPAVVKPLNLTLARPYDNMSIPGYTTTDAVTKKGPSSATDIAAVVLRTLNATQIDQAASLKPTFVTIGVYGNEALGPAGLGTVIDNVTLVPAALYGANYQKIVDTFKAAQGGTGKGIAATMPDVAAIALTTTVSPVLAVVNGVTYTVLSSKGGVAPMAMVPADSLLTLRASAYLGAGYGIPCALLDAIGASPTDPRRANCNKPLPDNCDLSGGLATCSANPGVVLYPDEVALLKARTVEYNAKITSIAGAAGYKIFDVYALFNDLRVNGRTYGAIPVTTSFLSGGFFSYDGVHPTSLGYAIVADEVIKFINASYGTSVPRVNMVPYLFNGNTSSGGYPVGLLTSNEQVLEAAAEVYSDENWENGLKSLFPLPSGRLAVTPVDGEIEVPAPRAEHGQIDR